jgi:hypothetical protein
MSSKKNMKGLFGVLFIYWLAFPVTVFSEMIEIPTVSRIERPDNITPTIPYLVKVYFSYVNVMTDFNKSEPAVSVFQKLGVESAGNTYYYAAHGCTMGWPICVNDFSVIAPSVNSQSETIGEYMLRVKSAWGSMQTTKYSIDGTHYEQFCMGSLGTKSFGPDLTGDVQCRVAPPFDRSCSVIDSTITLDHGTLTSSQVLGSKQQRAITINCSSDSAARLSVSGYTTSQLVLSNGLRSTLTFDGVKGGSTLSLKNGNNSIIVQSELDGSPLTTGPFNGTAVVVLETL